METENTYEMGAGTLSQKLITLRVLIAPYCQIPQSVISVVFIVVFALNLFPLACGPPSNGRNSNALRNATFYYLVAQALRGALKIWRIWAVERHSVL